MSIASIVRTAGPFAGTGSLVALPFAFKVFAASDLVVQRTSTSGAVTTLTLTTHYSVSLNADQDTSPGGAVTLVTALASGETAMVTSNVAATQPLQLASGGPFLPQQIEDALDRTMIIVQQQGVLGDQTLRLPLGQAVPELPTLASLEGRVLGVLGGHVVGLDPSSPSAVVLEANLASTADGKGASLVAVRDQQAITLQDLTVTAATEINLLRYIPPTEWANILAGTPSIDVRGYVQAAIDTGRPIYAPGIYKIVGALDFNRLCKLRGDGFNGGASAGSCFVFYNVGTAPAVTRTNTGATRVHAIIEDMAFKASSWDAATGANGHGLDTSAQLSQNRVQWIGFKRLGCYYHHDMSSNGPYESALTNVRVLYCGQHGIVVGCGANVVTLLNCESKWNGAPSYLTAPSVLGTWDGIVVDDYDDGTGYPSYSPEAATIIGGDASYNSRYGWSIVNTSYSHINPGYGEFNLSAYDMNVGSIQNTFVQAGRIPIAKVNLNASFSAYQRANTMLIGGRHVGAGNTNAAPQNSFLNNNLISYFSEDPTRANSVTMIADPATGNATLRANGAAILTLGSGAAVALPLNANVQFGGVNTTGAGSAALGANCPAATLTAPYKWVRVLAADGSTCFLPIWK